MKKYDWLVVLLITLISLFALKDLFKPGFYTSHDGIHQIVRLYYFDQAVRDGQIPPRWAGGLENGFGYPLFIFSYHMPWIIAEPFHILGFSVVDSIKITFILGFVLSGITMYFFQKELFGRLAGATGAVIYLFTPYRFSNIFVRAAIGDATAFIFPPLLFLSVYKLRAAPKGRWKWIVLGALSLSGLLLSHAMVFLFFFLCYFFYILFSLLTVKKKITFIISSASLTVLGFGLSAYYFIPSLMELYMTKFTATMKPVFVGLTFLNIKELIYSPWGFGLMHSAAGGMSFQVGITQWFIFLISIVTVVAALFTGKFRNKYEHISETVFFISIFILSLILTLPVSLVFWKILSMVVTIDYPWRILAVTVFAVSVLAGNLIRTVRFPYLVAICLVLLSFYANRNHIHFNKPLDWTMQFYLQLERSTNTYDEYLPNWVWPNYIQKPKPKVEFSGSGSQLSIRENKSNLLRFNLNTLTSGSVILNTIYYPGWHVYVNGKDIGVSANKIGLMEFSLKPGKYDVSARFSETPLRKLSDIVSLISIGIVLIGFLYHKKT